MTLLQRGQVLPATHPKETVPAPELGGDVIVRGMTLSERLALSALHSDLRVPQPGELDAAAQARAGAQMLPHTLALTVVLEDGQPLYSAAEWDRVGATHTDLAFKLFQVARRLGGQDTGELEKN